MPLVHFLANLDMIWLDHSREHAYVLLLQGGAENFLSVKVTAVLLSQESKIAGTAHFFLKESRCIYKNG